jgi:hypothetical protein
MAKKQEQPKTHAYDFSLKKSTKETRSNERPLPVQVMVKGLIKNHGIERARYIVKPLTVAAFADSQGTPCTANVHANYWTQVYAILKKVA